jgi:hypothetical protein
MAWSGRDAYHVSDWSTTEEDADATVDAILLAHRMTDRPEGGPPATDDPAAGK